jgi:DNA polymerase theta
MSLGRRVFWENGFRSIGSIANADPAELVPILMQVRSIVTVNHKSSQLIVGQAQPNKIRLKDHESVRYEEKLLAKANVILASANKLWRKLSSHYKQALAHCLIQLAETQLQADVEEE